MTENQDRERAWREWSADANWITLSTKEAFFAGWQAAMLRALEVTTEGFRDAEAAATPEEP